MTLKQWQDNGWLKPHRTSRKEIGDLLAIVHRDLTDARSKFISDDWRFGIAYNAALKVCTIPLYAEGYRSPTDLGHYRTIQAMPLIFGETRKADADYLDACRTKRNKVEYQSVGGVTEANVTELIEYVESLEKDVVEWLRSKHPTLAPSEHPPTSKKSKPSVKGAIRRKAEEPKK